MVASPVEPLASTAPRWDRSALDLLDQGAPLREVLTSLATRAEAELGPGIAASILLLDRDGLLRNGASPNLPSDYLDAIDRLRPSPNVGTCAAAAATGLVVITPDFRADDKWAELRHLPLALGYVGAWSVPIKRSNGTVLGTFGIYRREPGEPSADELATVQALAGTAAAAVERAARQGR